MSRREPPSVVIAKTLDQSGYLQDLRDDRSEESEGRIENLAELVSAAREYESREPEASLAGFVDRVSLLSEADETDGSEDARILLMTLHSAKGLEFPAVIMTGLEEGLFPHSRSSDEDGELEEERRLCYVGMTRARERLFLTSAARRRVFGEYRASQPSRFLDEVPEPLLRRHDFTGSSYQGGLFRGGVQADPYGRRPYGGGARRGGPAAGPGRVRDDATPWDRAMAKREEAGYAYEDEDQSGHGLRLGMRVRHAQFGVGTVLAVEGEGEELKLTVRFTSAGSKRLLARYARLERA